MLLLPMKALRAPCLFCSPAHSKQQSSAIRALKHEADTSWKQKRRQQLMQMKSLGKMEVLRGAISPPHHPLTLTLTLIQWLPSFLRSWFFLCSFREHRGPLVRTGALEGGCPFSHAGSTGINRASV